MSARVPLRPLIIDRSQAQIGRAVRALTWRDLLANAHHALGRGAQLVPCASGTTSTLTRGVKYTYSFYTRPRYQAFQRIWRFAGYGKTATTRAAVVVPDGSGTAANIALAQGTMRPARYVEDLTAQSETAGSIDVSVTPESGGSDVVLETIQCVEVPRVTLLTTGSDLGTDMRRTAPSIPITADSAGSDIGLHRLAAALDDYSAIGRRVGHFAWSVPYKLNSSPTVAFAKSTTSSSSVPFFEIAVRGILGRPGVYGATPSRNSLDFWALVKCSDASTAGKIRVIVSGGGGFADVDFPAGTTSWTWVQAGTALTIEAEDQTTSDGRRGSAWSDASVIWWRTAGSGTIYCAGLSLFET